LAASDPRQRVEPSHVALAYARGATLALATSYLHPQLFAANASPILGV